MRSGLRAFLLTTATSAGLGLGVAMAGDAVVVPPLSDAELAVASDPRPAPSVVPAPAMPGTTASSGTQATPNPISVPPLTAAEAGVALGTITVPSAPAPSAAPAIRQTAAATDRDRLPVAASQPATTAAAPGAPRQNVVATATPAPAAPAIPVPGLTPAETAAALGDRAAPAVDKASAEPSAPPATQNAAAPASGGPATAQAPGPDAGEAVRLAIAERLAAGLSGSGADERNAVAAFYAARGNAPAWTADGVLNRTGERILARLAEADADGLSAAAYAVPAVSALKGRETTPAAVAEVETAMSLAALAYSRDAAGGRIDPRRISKNIQVKPHVPEPLSALVELASASDPAAVLDGFNPPHPGFAALRSKLAALRAEEKNAITLPPPPEMPGGPILRAGMSDPRVTILRERLGLEAGPTPELFDDAVATAVRSYQSEKRIRVTGVVGPQTIATLNGTGPHDDVSMVDEVVANMERWRWMPRDLGAFHIFVNVPEYQMVVERDGSRIHESRVIVGKPDTPTPIFSEKMEYVIVNPYWHVPVSIMRKEFLPKLQADPSYLSRRGFELVSGGRLVDASQFDWTRGMPRVSIRQPPGQSNALGHIKFMFPNDFSVYLHDTSSRNLFSSERRSFSHGCVRVDKPFRLAEIVLGAENGWTEDKVRRMVGGREQRINLKETVEVHIAYFTATVDADGNVQRFDDIYGHDRAVVDALKALDEGRQERARRAS